MKLAVTIAGALLLVAASGVCADQKGKAAPAPKGGAARMPAPRNAAKTEGTPKKGGPGINNPLNLVQRLGQMTPEQRERILEQLPPDKQAQLRQKLEQFDKLPPARKELAARQLQSLNALPPEKQRIVTQSIAAANHLPADRKRPVFRELRSLLNLSEEDRATRLASDDFKKNYSPEEQKILNDLATNLPADYPIFDRK
jgi:hypothetical protein